MPKRTFKEIMKLAEVLRSDKGCPWDKKQTISSMLTYIDEEVDEVKEAVEKSDYTNLAEELGDVIFQLIMIAQIAKEDGYFEMQDVLDGIYDKITSRHTWVFGDDKAATPEEAIEMWKKNKEKEKNAKK